MHHEQLAIERKNMRDEIATLKARLKAIEEDFAECARGDSPCLFCAKSDTCNCPSDENCNFVWKHSD